MTYITICKHCGDQQAKLRANYLYTSSGEAIKLPNSSALETEGLPDVTFGDRKPKMGDEVELRCNMCGSASNLSDYELPEADKVTVPDVDALRKDISAMLDTARFAPRPPVFEPKPETKPCKACEDNCECEAREGSDGYCKCQGCDGCDGCACCCTCNNDDDEPTDPDPDDQEPDDFDRDENNVRQRVVRDMHGSRRWESLRDRISEKLEQEVPENSFYIVCDWESWKHWVFTDAYRASEKFLELESGEAEIFVQSLRNNFKVRAAAWNERVLNIDTE